MSSSLNEEDSCCYSRVKENLDANRTRDGQGTGRDNSAIFGPGPVCPAGQPCGTVRRKFIPVLVPRDTKTVGTDRDSRSAEQSRESRCIYVELYKKKKKSVEARDSGTVPGLSGILVPKCRDSLSRGILVAGLSRRFLFRSRLSRGFESRSRSWGFAGRDRDRDIVPGKPPIPE